MKTFPWMGILIVASLGIASTAQAQVTWYEFSFTAADLMDQFWFAGAAGTTAAYNGVYDGGRFSHGGDDPPEMRTYISTEHQEYLNWKSDCEQRLASFHLWGFGGLGPSWGEDYKHMNQASVVAPSGWTSWEQEWSGGRDENPNPFPDARILGWSTGSWIQGFHFDDGDLASQEFRFRLLLDAEDWRYYQQTYTAPNLLGGNMTFWFGGWMMDDSESGPYLYEGNMVLCGSEVPEVPEPSTLALLGLTGVAGLGWVRLRRRM